MEVTLIKGAERSPSCITHHRIELAYNLLYRVTPDGKLFSKKKELKIKKYGKQKYPTFTCSFNGKQYSLPVHHLAAYCFFHREMFNKDLVIRHLNGNVLDVSQENIKLGSHSENNQDKDPSVRSRAASIAAKVRHGSYIN